MADQQDRLAITPRVIDAGSRVIQMTHVTSAGYGTAYPFRPAGIALVLLAAGLVGAEVFRSGSAAFALKSGGSPVLWLAFAAAGVGIFLAIFAKRFLIIRTVDGARTALPAGDETVAAAVIGRIRDAMETGPAVAPAAAAPDQRIRLEPAQGSPQSLPIDTGAQSRTGPQRALPSAAPQTSPPRGLIASDPYANVPPASQAMAGARRQEGYVNGHSAASGGGPVALPDATRGNVDSGLPPRRSLSEYVPQRTPAERAPASQSGGFPVYEGPPSGSLEHRMPPQREQLALPANVPASPIPRDDPAHDLHVLMEHVRHADVQHKEALLDLLRVVDDHYRGRASREDAVAHWRSFADYVAQYLGSVDGLLTVTERFGRHMLPR